MKAAVSNISLPAYDHAAYFPALAETGFYGLEVAPSRVWKETGANALSVAQVADYRRAVETAGLDVCGLHSLFFDRPELSIFGDTQLRRATADFLVHLSGVCRDLGGRTMVFGSPQVRDPGDIARADADALAIEFFANVATRIETHGTVLCLEGLGPGDTPYIVSARHSLEIVRAVNHPAFRGQLDFRALTLSGELDSATVEAMSPYLCHVHVNAADVGALRREDLPSHILFAEALEANGYDAWVSLEQRMLDGDDVLRPIRASYAIIERTYMKEGSRHES